MNLLPRALTISVLLLPLAQLPEAQAARAPRVTNIDTGAVYTSIQEAINDADPDEQLTLRFSGTFREKIFITTRQETTTILGTGSKPTIDATGLNDAAITILSERPVTLRGFTVTGGSGADVNGERRGGGIVMRDCERLLLVDMTVHGNSADIGGGIEVARSQVGGPTALELAGKTVVRNNTAKGGGGILKDGLAGGGGGAIAAGPGVTVRLIDRASVRGNRCLDSQGQGGGIDIRGTAVLPSELQLLSRASITGNEAPLGGGGVSLLGRVSFNASSRALVSGNKTEGLGGGVVSLNGPDGSAPEIALACTLLNNAAPGSLGSGGAVFCAVGSLVLNAGARVFANRAGNDGGGIHLGGDSNQRVSFDITGASIAGNITEQGNGGGLRLQHASGSIDESVIRINRATGGRGGGISLNEAILTLGNTLVAFNRALPERGPATFNSAGGGLDIRNDSAVVISGDSSITKNEAAFSGGGISVVSSGLRITDGSRVNGNSVTLGPGGGIFAGNSLLELDGAVTIADNKAAPNSTGDGGGIFVEGSSLTMAGPGIEIRDNSGDEGGGVCARMSGNNAVFSAEGVAILDNSAQSDGGGLLLTVSTGVTPLLGNVRLAGNVAGRSGGGLSARVTGTSMSTANLSVTDNTAETEGGGMELLISPTSATQQAAVVMSGGIVAGNIGRDGGGIYVSGLGQFTMTGMTVETNVGRDGGGVSAAVPSVISNCTIRKNDGRDGGGLALRPSSSAGVTTYSLTGTAVTGNTARFGGGIDVAPASSNNRVSLSLGAGTSVTANRAGFDLKDRERASRSGGGIKHTGDQSIPCGVQVSGNFPNQITAHIGSVLNNVCP